jgi:hypothetical protein
LWWPQRPARDRRDRFFPPHACDYSAEQPRMEEIFLRHGAIRSKANRLRGNTEWTGQPRVGNYLCRACHTLCHNRPTNHAAPVTPSQPQAHTKIGDLAMVQYIVLEVPVFSPTDGGHWASRRRPIAAQRQRLRGSTRRHPKAGYHVSKHVTVVSKADSSLERERKTGGSWKPWHVAQLAHRSPGKNKPN